ncbi:glutaminyl-tRNA synthetase, partial [Trichinella spiralis]
DKAWHALRCHQKAEEVKGINPTPSPWRDRPMTSLEVVRSSLLPFS